MTGPAVQWSHSVRRPGQLDASPPRPDQEALHDDERADDNHHIAHRASRRRTVVYWIVSLPVLLETAAGIQWDFARNPTVVDALETIRFPDYMADVLGVAKILALLAILPPGMARAKEWAYACVSCTSVRSPATLRSTTGSGRRSPLLSLE